MSVAPMQMSTIEDLYRDYGPMVYRRARGMLGCEFAAEDAVQEVFARAIRSRSGFRATASPRTWLYRVTMNYCLNVKRDKQRRRRLMDVKVVPAVRTADTNLENVVKVRSLMAVMPDNVADAARCFYLAGMTQDETAEMLGVSRRTVGNRLKDFRQRALATRVA